MKVVLIILGIIFINQSIFGQFPDENDPEKHPYMLNKIAINTINNKNIQFYLNHPKIDVYSKMYYKREFAPSDDSITFGFLDSVMTKNSETRPFYFFVFNQIVNISDGALSEGIAFKCLDYVTKYPCEFTNYVLRDSLVKVDKWQGFLSFTLDDANNVKRIDNIEKFIQKTCPKYLIEWKTIRKGIYNAEIK